MKIEPGQQLFLTSVCRQQEVEARTSFSRLLQRIVKDDGIPLSAKDQELAMSAWTMGFAACSNCLVSAVEKGDIVIKIHNDDGSVVELIPSP